MTIHLNLVARVVCPNMSHIFQRSASNGGGCSRVVEVTNYLLSPDRNSPFSSKLLGALQPISCRVLIMLENCSPQVQNFSL